MVEILVVCTLSTTVFAALMGLWNGGIKMNRAAQSSTTLQNALLLEETIFQDFHQLGIDPKSVNSHLQAENCLSFYRVAFVGNEIRLRPVKYARVKGQNGLFFLSRTEVTPDGKTNTKVYRNAPLQHLSFGQLEDATFNRRYLRVDITVAESDRQINTSVQSANQERRGCRTLVARIPIPSGLGDLCLNVATKITPEPASGLLPLDPP